MKKKKILSILMIGITLITSFSVVTGGNEVNAAIFPISKADLYSKGEVVLFDYDNIGIGVEVIVYKKDGVEYPAYCINKGKTGVTVGNPYTVTVNQMLSNQKVWRAIINGYPFKTPAQLGCNTMEEAYAATKMAVYDAMYNYDLDKFTIHNDLDSNRRVVNAIKQIIKNARNSKETKIAATLQLKADSTIWQIDPINKNFVSKTYTVTASAANENYTISLKSDNDTRYQITNTSNVQKTTFSTNEKFKVLIPISDMEKGGEFTLTAASSLNTKPIYYGEATNEELQDLAITAGTYEMANATLKQTYQENKTKIQIIKRDGDTDEPLANAEFNLLDQNKNILYSELTSNSKGIVEIDNLLPGKYFIEEVKAPQGYYGFEGLIPVELNLHETMIVTVDNFEEPDEKPDDEPEEENEVSVGEKKLPQTGF